MFTPTLLRCNALPIIRALRSARLPLQQILKPQSLKSQWLRSTIKQRGASTAAKQARQSPYKYPDSIIVYQAPFVSTAFHCLTRATCLVIIPIGLAQARVHYLDPTTPNWTVPALIIGSALPFLAIACAYGPTVLQIKLHLPNSARRSKEALFSFASSSIPPNTRIFMRFIRFAPWPKRWVYHYSDLRRLPFVKWPLSNLEHVPLGREEGYGMGLKAWVGRRWFGRYWVDMTSATRDRSQVPGVWDRVWRGMPFAEEGKMVEGGAEKGAERKVGGMRNREVGTLGRQVVPGGVVKGVRSLPSSRPVPKRPR